MPVTVPGNQQNFQQVKDPNPTLSPGTLHFECTPAEMRTWCENFTSYFMDGTNTSSKKAISYLKFFMDAEYRKCVVEQKFCETKSLEENLKVLEEEKNVRYPLILRRL